MSIRSHALPSSPVPWQELDDTLREVVDEANAPLCLMSEMALLRQGLRHRAVALLLRDQTGRALLRPQSPNCWEFSSRALPRAMESAEECCRRLLETEWGLPTLIPRILRRVDACVETSMAFLTLYTAHISNATARALAMPGVIDPDGLPLLDAIELAGLADQEPPLLSPLLRHVVRSGWLEEHNFTTQASKR